MRAAAAAWTLLVITTPSVVSLAEPPAQPTASELLLDLRRLRVVGSVLYVAAHPDDENTSLLAYLVRGRMLRATYLSITRGDGGQNLVGSEQGIELGIIRTQELLAARRIDGAEQVFTRARDFGFSKSPEETLRIWGRDEVLADVVRAIRRLRPDVVVARFSSQHGEGQHGHHTASARLAEEAFRLAADPGYPAERVSGLPPWQARRLLWNRSSWGAGAGEDLSAFAKLDIGAYLPLLGTSVGEIAAQSRSMHKSQGFGVAARRGPIVEYFKTLAGEPAGEPLGGIDVSWKRFGPAGARVDEVLARAEKEFRVDTPDSVLPLLLQADAALGAVADADWREYKRRALRELIAACAGLHLEAVAAEPSAVAGSQVKVIATALNRSAAPLSLLRVRVAGGPAREVGKPLVKNEASIVEETLAVPAGTPASNPCWLEAPPAPGLFGAAEPASIGVADSPPAFEAVFEVGLDKAVIAIRRPVGHRWVDPVAGERTRAFAVVPEVSVAPMTPVLMFADRKAQRLGVRVRAGGGKPSGTLRLEAPAGWSASPAEAAFALGGPGDEQEITFLVAPAKGAARGGAPVAATLRAVARTAQGRFSRALRTIQHDHIPPQAYLAEAEVRLQTVDLRTQGLRVGYVPGAGDEVAESLRRVGYEVTVLGDEALAARRLADFDAIVVGVRAFNTNERMRVHRERLLRYVADGGTLVVQYNTQSRIARLVSDIGPLPFEITRDRVTDENAKVTFAEPKHPVLTTPNALGPADFEGWVQERGLYFAGKWDAKYAAPLDMADPGEKPSRGSLLVLRHGKGRFVYTGLAFFRQLPAGVPGAYRLFANLLAHAG